MASPSSCRVIWLTSIALPSLFDDSFSFTPNTSYDWVKIASIFHSSGCDFSGAFSSRMFERIVET